MKKEKIIFKCGQKGFVFQDIVKTIKKSGIKKGDVAMVHADLSKFGKLGDIVDKTEFANVFIEAFLKTIGKGGTLIVPTFTYSFCNNEIYDPDNTPSTVGLFTEELRKRKDAYRSIHPIFSVAAIGKRAEELTSNLSKNSFGKGSIYDKLANIRDSKYIIFGVHYFVCTQIHYIEEKIGVSYRYTKKFKGKIKIKNKVYNDEYEYYVRPLDESAIPDFSKIEKNLLDSGLLKKLPLGCAKISVAIIGDICREGIKMFKNDPTCFIKTNTKI